MCIVVGEVPSPLCVPAIIGVQHATEQEQRTKKRHIFKQVFAAFSLLISEAWQAAEECGKKKRCS